MAKTKGVFKGFDTPQKNPNQINDPENKINGQNAIKSIDTTQQNISGRHSKNFYEELNNSPFVLGIYSSEFNNFFNNDKLYGLLTAQNERQGKKSLIETDYIHQYITSLNFSSSINAPYMTMDFTAKMPAEQFHYYFQNPLTKSPTTGQWIALYTRNEKSSDIILKQNIPQNVDQNQFDDLIPDQQSGFQKILNQTTNADNTFNKILREKVDLQKKQQRDFSINLTSDKVIENFQIQVETVDSKLNEYYQSHHCIFWGIVDDLGYKMSATPTGIPMFEISVRCLSFQAHLEKDQYLVALPLIEENINGAVYNKSLSEYAKNNKFKPVQAFIKDIDYWKSMIDEFANAGTQRTQNLGYEIKKILLSLTRNYLPLDMHSTTTSKVFLDPISKEKINENRLLTLGSVINVASEQQHLPTQSIYRQMLPLTARHTTTIDRFKTTVSGKGTVWNLINGTFVVDQNLIECFPIMIPFNNRKELMDIVQNYANNFFINSDDNEYLNDNIANPKFKPYMYDEAIYKFYEQLGAIPTLIYRLKPLQPNGQISKDNINLINEIADIDGFEYLENSTYSEKLRLDKNRKIQYAENGQNKEIDIEKFGFENSLNFNKDAPFSKLLPSINFDELLSFEAKQNENDRINGLYIESPIVRNKSNMTIGSFADPIIDIKDAVTQGFRFYDSDYPFFDTYIGSKPKEMSAMIERYYAIYGGGQNRSKGMIQLKMNYNPELLTGSWLRIRMNNDQEIINSEKIKIKGNEEYEEANKEAAVKKALKLQFDDVSDFFCYIETISYNYAEGPGLNCICTIQFSRGSFGLNYAHFPNVRLANHLESTKTYNEVKINQYLDDQKSKTSKTVPTAGFKSVANDKYNEKALKETLSKNKKDKITATIPSINDFIQKLPTNPTAKRNDAINIKEGLKDILNASDNNENEKRFENNETTLDLKNTPKEIELPIIKKHNSQPIIKFGPYKSGATGPFPNWPDVNGDLILGMAEFRVICPNPIEDLQNIIALNEDAISRGFEQLEEPDVLEWQVQNGIIPVGVIGE